MATMNLTYRLINRLVKLADGPAQPDLRRARRSDPPRHPRSPDEGGGLGDGAGQAVRHEPPRGVEAPQGAGAGRAHLARPRRTVASLPARRQPAATSGRPGGALPQILERKFRSTRRIPEAVAEKGERETWSQAPQ